MTQPLALVLYEKLLPGTQVVNRLQDLKYRVETVPDGNALVVCAQQEKPMLVLIGLDTGRTEVLQAIRHLRSDVTTQHVPVIAFGPEEDGGLQEAARKAGATLVVSDAAVVNHLPQFLEQALHVD